MHYNHINSLRGIAILLVILVHTSQLLQFENRYVGALFGYGKMGVQLFFIASAFTLCLSSDIRHEKNRLLNFYLRRYFRIFPMYYLGIGVYFIVRSYFNDDSAYSLENVLSNVFFIHGLVPSANNSIVPGGWSIGTEILFYFIFPFLFPFIRSGHSILKAVILSVISLFTVFILYYDLHLNPDFVYFNIMTQLPVFVVGILFYIYRERLTNIYMSLGIFMLFFLLTWYLSLFKEVWFLLPLFAGISFCGLFNLVEKISALNNIVFQKIGVNSYSMYLTHFIAFYFFPKVDSLFILLLIYIAIVACTYTIAIPLNKYIEKPFIRLGASIIKQKNEKL